jgi:multidrug efflux pump subunit AcrB
MQMERLKELLVTNWAINNRTSVYVLTIIISLAGLFVFNSIPKEQFPDIVIPTISVVTIYPGATPEDIENLITKPIEKQLKSVSGIKKVTSTSIQDVSIITAEFATNQKVPECKLKVSDAVDKAKSDLPSDLDNDPQVKEFDFSEFPIMNINISGDIPLDRLKKYAEDLEDKIEGLPEITRVDIVGGLDREIQINVDLYKMQAAGITFGDIEGAVARENVNISGGDIRVDDERRSLRVTGQFKSPKAIENIVVRSFQGTTVFLRDIATVTDGYKEKQDFARLDRKTVISMNVIKRSGENLIAASDKINEIIDDFKATKFPAGLNVTITGDQSDNTRVSIADLINTIVIGFTLVLIVLMFFMGLSNAFFVALAVPLSSLIAFLFLPGLDYTLNVIVLFSFLLALGIIVDDAIVVIENTHRIYNKYDFDVMQAAKYAAGEVFVPVLAGTLTTIAPFFPLLFWPGIAGEFMGKLPVTLIITLGASLFVAFIMNPVFAVSFMKKGDHAELPPIRSLFRNLIIFGVLAVIGYLAGGYGFGNFMVFMIVMAVLYHFVLTRAIKSFQEKVWPKFINGYRKVLSVFVKGYRPIAVVAVTFIATIVTIAAYFSSEPRVEFFPSGDPNFAYVYIQAPLGTDAEVTDSITAIAEKKVYEVLGQTNPNVKSVIANVGLNAGDPQNPDRVPTPYKGKVTVAFVKYADRKDFNTAEALTKIREKFKKEPIQGVSISVDKEANGPPVGKPVNMEISGDEFPVLLDLQEKVFKAVAKANIKGMEEFKSDLQLNKPEIIIDIDQEKAQREGVSKAQIGMDLRTALFGKEISKYKDANDDAPIQLRLNADYRKKVEQLTNLQISFMDMASGRFKQLPLSSVVNIRYAQSFNGINRKNQKRVVSLSSNVENPDLTSSIVAQLNGVISTIDVPEGYEIKMTGAQEDQKETSDFLGVAFLAAILLMFFILVTQFNSVVKPMLIFSTIFFSLMGVFLGFIIFNFSFSIVMTGVGIFALSGIVIRNGILLIEFIDELRQRGESITEAVVDGGATRLTPVFLTAVSAILGLIPLAIGLNIDFAGLFTHFNPHFHLGGDNVAFWGPLAWTMIFGLVIATFLTLLVVPTMYMMAYKTKHKVLGWFTKK